MKKISVFALLTLSAAPVLAAEVKFDYMDKSGGTLGYAAAAGSDFIRVTVENTCEGFEIAYKGHREKAKAEETTSGAENAEAKAKGCSADVLKKVCYASADSSVIISHQPEYSGYEVEVSRPSGAPEFVIYHEDFAQLNEKSFCDAARKEASVGTGDIDPAVLEKVLDEEKAFGGYKIRKSEKEEYIVVVNESPWTTEFSVGPAVSQLTSPVYYVDENNVIQEDRGAESGADLILAAFAHVSHKEWRNGALRFGISGGVGTSTGSSLDYFVGFSAIVGPAIFTFGNHWGSVHRLKNGLRAGMTTTDPAVVSEDNMSERIDDAFFLSLTYTFGSGADQASFGSNIARIVPVQTEE